MTTTKFNNLSLRLSRMDFNLVYHRLNLCMLQKGLQMRDIEIAHANGFYQPFCIQGFKSPPCFRIKFFPILKLWNCNI